MTAMMKKETPVAACKVENASGGATVIVLNANTCAGCEDRYTCEQAYRDCRACVTMPELFESQR